MAHILKYSDYAKEYLNIRGALTSGLEHHDLSVTYKFGHNDSIGTSYAVVSEGAIYRCPLATNATTVRIKAGGHINDIVGGSGARAIVIVGIDHNGDAVVDMLPTNGADTSLDTEVRFMRVYRSLVTETGTHQVDMLGGGHASTITIENSAGTEDWAYIRYNGFPDSQTQIGAFSLGNGQRGYLSGINIFVDSNKAVDFLLVFRTSFMIPVAPFEPIRLGSELNGVSGEFNFTFPEPPRFFPNTDIALLAKVASGSAKVSTNMAFIVNEA